MFYVFLLIVLSWNLIKNNIVLDTPDGSISSETPKNCKANNKHIEDDTNSKETVANEDIALCNVTSELLANSDTNEKAETSLNSICSDHTYSRNSTPQQEESNWNRLEEDTKLPNALNKLVENSQTFIQSHINSFPDIGVNTIADKTANNRHNTKASTGLIGIDSQVERANNCHNYQKNITAEIHNQIDTFPICISSQTSTSDENSNGISKTNDLQAVLHNCNNDLKKIQEIALNDLNKIPEVVENIQINNTSKNGNQNISINDLDRKSSNNIYFERSKKNKMLDTSKSIYCDNEKRQTIDEISDCEYPFSVATQELTSYQDDGKKVRQNKEILLEMNRECCRTDTQTNKRNIFSISSTSDNYKSFLGSHSDLNLTQESKENEINVISDVIDLLKEPQKDYDIENYISPFSAATQKVTSDEDENEIPTERDLKDSTSYESTKNIEETSIKFVNFLSNGIVESVEQNNEVNKNSKDRSAVDMCHIQTTINTLEIHEIEDLNNILKRKNYNIQNFDNSEENDSDATVLYEIDEKTSEFVEDINGIDGNLTVQEDISENKNFVNLRSIKHAIAKKNDVTDDEQQRSIDHLNKSDNSDKTLELDGEDIDENECSSNNLNEKGRNDCEYSSFDETIPYESSSTHFPDPFCFKFNEKGNI